MKKYNFLIAVLFFMQANAQQNLNMLVGTYTNSCDSKGIYVYEFNSETAAFKLKQTSPKSINPSYLTVSPDRGFVYSVNESGKGSTVSAFKFDSKSGKLDLINKQSSEGADPCHIINDNQNVLVANYSGGSISAFKKKQDGSLDKPTQVIKHQGSSINKERQEAPHVHMLQFSPDKQFVLASDLGTDRIYLYQYAPDSVNEILKFKDTIAIKTGSGPRHLTFSPDGKFVYLLQELDGTITVFDYFKGKFQRIQETTVAQKGKNGAAAIRISDDGRFLYATNRGEANTISMFEINAKGKLIHKSTIPTGGKNPRDFAIVPRGKFVLVAHQDTNDIIIFKRNESSGELSVFDKKIELCAPVNLVFTEE